MRSYIADCNIAAFCHRCCLASARQIARGDDDAAKIVLDAQAEDAPEQKSVRGLPVAGGQDHVVCACRVADSFHTSRLDIYLTRRLRSSHAEAIGIASSGRS